MMQPPQLSSSAGAATAASRRHWHRVPNLLEPVAIQTLNNTHTHTHTHTTHNTHTNTHTHHTHNTQSHSYAEETEDGLWLADKDRTSFSAHVSNGRAVDGNNDDVDADADEEVEEEDAEAAHDDDDDKDEAADSA